MGTGGFLSEREGDHVTAFSAEAKIAFVVEAAVAARVLRPELDGWLCKCHGVELGFGRVLS